MDLMRQRTQLAAGFVGSQPLELWCGKRKVKSFAAVAAAAD